MQAISKRVSKTLAMALCIGLLLVFLPVTASANSNTQDGLLVNLYTDKASYAVGETVIITAEVTNNNSVAVSNVVVSVSLPEGIALKSGVTATSTVSLSAGQTLKLVFGATATRAGASGIPQTGDGSHMVLWIVFALLSTVGLAAMLAYTKKKKGVKTLSMLLCFVLLATLVAPALPVHAATVNKSFAVSESFKAGGTTYPITATASYDWDDSPTPANIPVTGVTVSPTTANLTVGGAQQLTAAVAPANATNQAVTWESSDTAIAEVDANGLVTAKALGNATITVKTTDGNKTATTAVSVVPAYSLTISNISSQDAAYGTVAITMGSATGNASGASVTVTATPQNGCTFEKWVASDDKTATAVSTNASYTFNITQNTTLYAVYKPTAANAEAVKITGFAAGTNNQYNLIFSATGYGTLTAGTTLNFVSMKTGANAAIAAEIATNGADLLTPGSLRLDTNTAVNAADLTYVELTFTATLNGVTSDPVTLDISSLFGAGTTAGKLRTDKAKFTGPYSASGWNGTPGSQPLKSSGNGITLSAGVSINNTVAFGVTGGTGTSDYSRFSISAVAGGQVMINTTFAPTGAGAVTYDNVTIWCDGTSYSVGNVNVNVDAY